MKHNLFSQNSDMPVKWYDKFDREQIKSDIIEHLGKNPSDTLEHCKEYSKEDAKKYYGMEIVSFYAVNPKTGKPSKVITRGNKDYFKPLM